MKICFTKNDLFFAKARKFLREMEFFNCLPLLSQG
jgi:hypothetical protein